MANTIKVNRGLEAAIPELKLGEPFFTTDTNKLFVGTGVGNIQIGGDGSGSLPSNAVLSDDLREIVILEQDDYDELPVKDPKTEYRIISGLHKLTVYPTMRSTTLGWTDGDNLLDSDPETYAWAQSPPRGQGYTSYYIIVRFDGVDLSEIPDSSTIYTLQMSYLSKRDNTDSTVPCRATCQSGALEMILTTSLMGGTSPEEFLSAKFSINDLASNAKSAIAGAYGPRAEFSIERETITSGTQTLYAYSAAMELTYSTEDARYTRVYMGDQLVFDVDELGGAVDPSGLISADTGNVMITGTDGKLLVPESSGGGTGPQGPQGEPGTDGHSPYIGENGYWYVWDAGYEDFIQTGVPAQGPQGAQGYTGPQGLKGDTGDQGVKGDTGATGATGSNGSTFTPSVASNGDLSWTNNGGLQNPTTVNIRGPQGPPGQGGGGPGGGSTIHRISCPVYPALIEWDYLELNHWRFVFYPCIPDVFEAESPLDAGPSPQQIEGIKAVCNVADAFYASMPVDLIMLLSAILEGDIGKINDVISSMVINKVALPTMIHSNIISNILQTFDAFNGPLPVGAYDAYEGYFIIAEGSGLNVPSLADLLVLPMFVQSIDIVTYSDVDQTGDLQPMIPFTLPDWASVLL